jgi:SAM-dependent methyltransferase
VPTSPPSSHEDELAAVRARYKRRSGDERRYSLLDSASLYAFQERQRALAALFIRLGWHDLSPLRVLEVGSGSGANLLEFLRLGFRPEHLQGIELLPESAEHARRLLPESVRIHVGDAVGMRAAIDDGSQNIVYQATVFSSLLDEAFQRRLADAMWRWACPGGGILWYDFTVNNPWNQDVHGVPVARIRQLFPEGKVWVRRLTLAPPIARAVVRVHPALYTVFNAPVALRTHVLAWVEKLK